VATRTSPATEALTAHLELPGRILDAEELAEVARSIASREELWRPHVEHDEDERTYESIHLDEHVGIWAIAWMPGHDTGFHDHDGSAGAFAVALGQIREERPVLNEQPRRLDAGVGESASFDPTQIHRMVNLGEDPVVTIHAYSPPLTSMGMYRVDDDGAIRRCSVDWDEKLKAS
jgi:predicted metal-dependent enzyme (double-stranded beta helix superfamily)